MTLPKRSLGSLSVGALGLGCMGMTGFYGPTDDAESERTLREAVDFGVTLFDTADRYGLGKNEALVGRVLRGLDVQIATKFGIVPGSEPGTRALDGSRAYVRSACEASLARLGRERIELYFVHRVGKTVPIEETIGALGELVQEGKVGAIGLSEVSVETLRRAAAVHPIAAVESELSLFHRSPEHGMLAACAELGTGFVAYSPLGAGFLAGTIDAVDGLTENDYRRTTAPRFSGANFAHNQALLAPLTSMARDRGCTPAQLALAWLLRVGPHVVPIPGTKRRVRLAENVAAASIQLSDEDFLALDRAFPSGAVSGDPHPPDGMKWLNG